MEKEYIIGETYSISGYGQNHKMECIGIRYDNKIIFISKEKEIPKSWIRMMGIEKGFSLRLLKQTYIIGLQKNIDWKENKTYKWFVERLSNLRFNNISIENLNISLIIAKSMILSDKEIPKNKWIQSKGVELLHKKGIEILLQKQKEFKEFKEFQVSQLPFGNETWSETIQIAIQPPTKEELLLESLKIKCEKKMISTKILEIIGKANPALFMLEKARAIRKRLYISGNLTKDYFLHLLKDDENFEATSWNVEKNEKSYNYRITGYHLIHRKI